MLSGYPDRAQNPRISAGVGGYRPPCYRARESRREELFLCFWTRASRSRGWGEGPVSGANKGPRCGGAAPTSESPEPPRNLSCPHTTALPSAIASTLMECLRASQLKPSCVTGRSAGLRDADARRHFLDIELSRTGVATAVSPCSLWDDRPVLAVDRSAQRLQMGTGQELDLTEFRPLLVGTSVAPRASWGSH